MITPYNDKINVYYTGETYSYDFKDSETSNYLVASDPGFPMDPALGPDQKNISLKIHNGLKLTSISSNTSVLTFTSGSRADLPGSSMIQRIDIQNSSGRLNKSFDFSYSSFLSNGSGLKPLRLRLDYIEEFAGISPNRISGGKHVFDYNVSVNLPNWDPYGKAINSQDLWGFYNGANNSILTQSLKVDIVGGQLLMQGGQRHTSPQHAQANVLTKITYPTGGFTAFDYESNQVFASDKDFLFLNAAPVTKGDFLVVVSREPLVEKILTLKDPDPLTGKIPFETRARSMVQACPSDANGFPTCYQMYIEGVSPTVYPKTIIKEGIQSLLLDPGTYKISGVADTGMENIYKVKDVQAYHLTVEWQEFPSAANYAVKENKNIGGLRIKRITNYSATGNLNIKRYDYNILGSTTSSGVLVNFPQSFATKFKVVYDPRTFVDGQTTESVASVKYGEYLQVRSYPLSPMQATQAGTVGYANVTEYSGEFGENGKTEYTFTTAIDHPDINKNFKPFPQSTSFDWRRGLLLLQSIYSFDNAAGNFKIVRSVTNEYKFDKNIRNAYGFSFEKYAHTHSKNPGGGLVLGAYLYYVAGYKLTTEFYYKNRETIREYSPAGSTTAMETIIDYDYGYANGHYQLTLKTERNSNNSVVVTTNKYPDNLDLGLPAEAETARQSLQSKFMKSVLLEQSVTKDVSLLMKTVNKYKVNSGIPTLASVEVQTEANPIEQRIQIVSYDDVGNAVRQKKKDDVDNTFIWAHNKTYLIAQVQNALESDVAYTSFETTDAPYWAFTPSHPALVTGVSRTGDKFITIPSGTNISRTGLSSTASYVVSYWSKNGSYSVNGTTGSTGSTINGWTYYEHAISNPGGGTITLTGTGSIDELRLYPKNAQMVTYCYNPAVGILCSTDANSVTTSYEYDLLGRLKVIRDTNQKILKTLVYHFKGE